MIITSIVITIVFILLAYSGYTLSGIYDREGTNTYGKYKIKTIVYNGITYYVPVCYCGKLFWKSYWYPLCRDIKIHSGAKSLPDDIYGWENKMECIDFIETQWKNLMEKRKFEEQVQQLKF